MSTREQDVKNALMRESNRALKEQTERLEKQARYAKALYESRYYIIEADKLGEEYDSVVNKERLRLEEDMKNNQNKEENGNG